MDDQKEVKYWVFGGVHPFSWFQNGWREVSVEEHKKFVIVRLKTKKRVVRLPKEKWLKMIEDQEVKTE